MKGTVPIAGAELAAHWGIAPERELGDNTGSMALKGANPDHEGEARPDRWAMSDQLEELAARWQIAPERDLTRAA